MDPWVSGLIASAIAFVISVLAFRTQKGAIADSDGWTSLRPGWFLHSIFAAGVAITALFVWIGLNGGSSRPDASIQNLYLIGLLASFTFMNVYLWWTSYAQTIAWNGRRLRVRNVFGKEWDQEFTAIRLVRTSAARGDCYIRFTDGRRVLFSIYLRGAKELLRKLPQRAGKFPQPPASL